MQAIVAIFISKKEVYTGATSNEQIEACKKTWIKDAKQNSVEVIFTDTPVQSVKSLQSLKKPAMYYFLGTCENYINTPRLIKYITEIMIPQQLHVTISHHDFRAGAIISHDYLFAHFTTESIEEICEAIYTNEKSVNKISEMRSCNIYGKKRYDAYCCRFYYVSNSNFEKDQILDKIISCANMNPEIMMEYYLDETQRIDPNAKIVELPEIDNKWTIVTCLFDTNRPNHNYLELSKFVLSLKVNLVVFCDEKTADFFQKERDKNNLTEHTKIVPMDIKESYIYSYRDKIRNKKNRVFIESDQDLNDRLVLIYCSKLFLMNKAIENGYFSGGPGSTGKIGFDYPVENRESEKHFYGWIDIAIFRHESSLAHQLYRNMSIYREKCSYCYINFTARSIVNNLDEYYKTYRCNSAGGFFTGEKQNMLTLCDLYKNKFIEHIEKGYLYAEEQLLHVIHLENPDLFEFFYGDFWSLLANYDHLRKDIQSILNIYITNTRSLGENALCLRACKMLYRDASGENPTAVKTAYLFPDQKIKLADEMFISAFYCQDNDYCLKAMQMIDSSEFDSLISEHILNNTNFYWYRRSPEEKKHYIVINSDKTLEELLQSSEVKATARSIETLTALARSAEKQSETPLAPARSAEKQIETLTAPAQSAEKQIERYIIYSDKVKISHYSLCHRDFIILPIDRKNSFQFF